MNINVYIVTLINALDYRAIGLIIVIIIIYWTKNRVMIQCKDNPAVLSVTPFLCVLMSYEWLLSDRSAALSGVQAVVKFLYWKSAPFDKCPYF